MRIKVNDSLYEIESGLLGEGLLSRLGIPPAAVVAEVNGALMPRERFLAYALCEGDSLELVALIGGG